MIQQLGPTRGKCTREKSPTPSTSSAPKTSTPLRFLEAYLVNAGSIAAARNEGELAGVIAHEVIARGASSRHESGIKGLSAKAGLACWIDLESSDNALAGILPSSVGWRQHAFPEVRPDRKRQSDLEGAGSWRTPGTIRVIWRISSRLWKRWVGRESLMFMSDHPDPGNRNASIDESNKALPVIRTRSR
jgi:hypothetical protein